MTMMPMVMVVTNRKRTAASNTLQERFPEVQVGLLGDLRDMSHSLAVKSIIQAVTYVPN
jgi:hypothetical protein